MAKNDAANAEPTKEEKKDAGVTPADEIKSDAAKTKKTDNKKNPVAYTAPHPVYLGQKYYQPGEVFVTNEDAGELWVKVTPKDAKIIEAATNPVPGDVPIEGLDDAALQALAATKNVNPAGLDRDKLIDAIRAAQEPAL